MEVVGFPAEIDDIDQDPADWATDPQTITTTQTGAHLIASSVESGNPSDILLNYSEDVKFTNPNNTLSLPFSIIVNDSEATILAIVLTTSTQITITLNSPITVGQVITCSYERELGGDEIQGLTSIEVGPQDKFPLSNNV